MQGEWCIKKKMGKNMSNKELMRMILAKMMEEEFNDRPQKTKKSKSVTGDTLTGSTKGDVTEVRKISRYIPAAKKRATLQKANGRCAYPGCTGFAKAIETSDGLFFISNSILSGLTKPLSSTSRMSTLTPLPRNLLV